MLKIRWSHDCLIFNMGIPKLVRPHLYTETPPWLLQNLIIHSYLHNEISYTGKTWKGSALYSNGPQGMNAIQDQSVKKTHKLQKISQQYLPLWISIHSEWVELGHKWSSLSEDYQDLTSWSLHGPYMVLVADYISKYISYLDSNWYHHFIQILMKFDSKGPFDIKSSGSICQE